MTAERRQRVAAYNVCVDEQRRLLLCRLTAITDLPGWWTLPGGGIDFGEHPAAAAGGELTEETGLDGVVGEVLAVQSACRIVEEPGGMSYEHHSIRIVYRTEITGPAELRHEIDGSTDVAAWFHRDEVDALALVDVGQLGVRLAFGEDEA